MIYFVTEAFIKDKTHITQNVDAKDLAPYIPMSVKVYIEPILGYTLFGTLPSRGASAGLIFGVLGFIATFVL